MRLVISDSHFTMRFNSSDKPKLKHKRGLWSPDEDQKLRDYIINHGLGCWSSVPIHAGKLISVLHDQYMSFGNYVCVLDLQACRGMGRVAG